MVNDDPWRAVLAAVSLAATFACGCLQTGDGGARGAGGFGFHASRGPTADDGFALAVAKPARGAVASRAEPPPAPAAEQGPDLNPVQTASAKEDMPPAEQAPAPRPAPAADKAAPPPAATAKAPPAPAGQAAPPAPPGMPLKRPGQAPGQVTPASYPPGATGFVPPGGLPLDPHQRPVPTAAGALLNLPPGESPAERALELNARLTAAEADRQALDLRGRELMAALEGRDRALQQHSRDIHEAAEEVAKAREQVTAWRKELDDARVKLRSRELEDVTTLKAIIAVLERLTESGGPDARHEGAPPRMPEE